MRMDRSFIILFHFITFSELLFSIHQLMATSLLRCPPLTSSPSLLVLGLGGGCLPSFFLSQLPQAQVTAVDVDETMVELAKTYFKMPVEVTTVVMDGVKYVEEMAEKGKQVDYLFVDIDSKDNKGTPMFPPMSFLSVCELN